MRTLTLRRELLTELTRAELSFAGGTAACPTHPCVFTVVPRCYFEITGLCDESRVVCPPTR